MTKYEKKWIDGATYRQLLDNWRNAPIGSHWFVGDTGDYYAKVMMIKQNEVGPSGHVQASKDIGWVKP